MFFKQRCQDGSFNEIYIALVLTKSYFKSCFQQVAESQGFVAACTGLTKHK